MEKTPTFTSYQKLAIALLALTQFTVILDFMVISPLGDFLMKDLSLKPKQFGLVVSAYAITGGLSGLLTAGFADKFDRKKLLLFFYIGFILGTFFCGISHTYMMLLAARIVTGLFGGVIGSISVAIVTDLFPLEKRGRVMGYMQMGFAGSQVLGIPMAIYMARHWGWQSPFLLVVGLAIIIALLVAFRLQPVRMHLELQHEKNPLQHLLATIGKRNYRIGFAATALLSIGGFMMMPFGSAFAINNLHVSPDHLWQLFLVGGIGSLISMPLIGKLADKMDKFTLFAIASVYMMIVVVIYTNLGPEPLWFIMIFNILTMIGIFGRIIPSTAITTAIPVIQDRGAFMSINTSLQQIAGGIAAFVGGMIVVQRTKFSPLEHYNTLGYVIVGITCIAIVMMYRVDRMVKNKILRKPQFETSSTPSSKGEIMPAP